MIFVNLFNAIQEQKNIEPICPYLLDNNPIIYSSVNKLRKLSDYYVISDLCTYLLSIKNFEFIFFMINMKIIYPAIIHFWDNNKFTQTENETNCTKIIKHVLDNNIYYFGRCIAIYICSYSCNYDIITYMNTSQLYDLQLYIYGNNKEGILKNIKILITFESSLRYLWITSCILL